MRRFAALVAAAAMVLGAYALRQAGDSDDGSTNDGPASRAAGIVCASDLAEVCEAAGISIAAVQPAGETADALIGADHPDALGGSAWLVTSAWADLVRAERDRVGDGELTGVAGEPLASSPVVLAVWSDRADQLASRCGTAIGWRCLGEQAGATLDAGDRVQVAAPDVDSATGLVIAASQAVGVVGRADFASNDAEAGTLARLAPVLARRPAEDPLRRMRAQGPGEVTATGTLQAHATNLRSTFGTIVADTVVPPVRADIVLVVPAGVSVDDADRRALADALLAAGWHPPADAPAGLPGGGVLAAIRTLWAQNR